MKGRLVQTILLGLLAYLPVYAGQNGQNLQAPSDKAAESIESAESGDLIFLNLNCGPLCDAIEEATADQFGTSGPKFSHIGIIDRDDAGEMYVIEALPKSGVVRTPIGIVLQRLQTTTRSEMGFVIGKFKPSFREAAMRALHHARSFLGAPYESTFAWASNRYYCSKLIHSIFQFDHAPSGFFTPRPMTFGKPGSWARKIFEAYFNGIGAPIPEGMLGVSPQSIFLEGKQKYFQ